MLTAGPFRLRPRKKVAPHRRPSELARGDETDQHQHAVAHGGGDGIQSGSCHGLRGLAGHQTTPHYAVTAANGSLANGQEIGNFARLLADPVQPPRSIWDLSESQGGSRTGTSGRRSLRACCPGQACCPEARLSKPRDALSCQRGACGITGLADGTSSSQS